MGLLLLVLICCSKSDGLLAQQDDHLLAQYPLRSKYWNVNELDGFTNEIWSDVEWSDISGNGRHAFNFVSYKYLQGRNGGSITGGYIGQSCPLQGVPFPNFDYKSSDSDSLTVYQNFIPMTCTRKMRCNDAPDGSVTNIGDNPNSVPIRIHKLYSDTDFSVMFWVYWDSHSYSTQEIMNINGVKIKRRSNKLRIEYDYGAFLDATSLTQGAGWYAIAVTYENSGKFKVYVKVIPKITSLRK